MLGAVGLTVKNCRFENVGFGVWTEYAGSSDFYIADNLFLGRDDRFRLIGWTGPLWASAGAYGSHLLTSYYAIKVYGPGHVIAHNAIAYFHDGIGISTYGTPPRRTRTGGLVDRHLQQRSAHAERRLRGDRWRRPQRARHNNRGVNAAQGGYSAQPVFGGPVYFIRNILYHVPSGVAFKFSAKPAGLFVYHNTIIGEQVVAGPVGQHALPEQPVPGPGHPRPRHHDLGQRDGRLQLGLQRLSPEQRRDRAIPWLAPATGQRLYEPKPEDWKTFATLADFRAATGRRRTASRSISTIFERTGPARPGQPPRGLSRHGPELPAEAGSKAVDAGVVIPHVNDGFTGRAPDLGALEVGKPEPSTARAG